MIGFIKRLTSDRRGNILAIAGASLPLLVGAAGLATDTIQWTLWKRQLQRAADSAALAGVYDRSSAAGDYTTVPTTVAHDLELNRHTSMGLQTGYPIITYPADDGLKTWQVNVKLAVQKSLPFSSFFGSVPTITASATAASIASGGEACVNARETSGTKSGIIVSGSAGIYMPDCVLYSNSPSTNSAAAGGSSNVTADAVAGVGGIQESNNWNVNAYRPYSPPVDDPFANVTPNPADMNCATTALTDSTNVTAQRAAGTNCWSSLLVNSNRTLTLPDGTYYINAGNADIRGNLTCNSCTIVLTNNTSSSPIGQFKVNAGSQVNMTAPTTGTYKGIAVYQDRRAVDSGQTNKINGSNSSIIQGALYFPSQQLDYNGEGTTTAVCTMFVARRINFTGNNTTTNKFKKLSDCSAFGIPGGSTTTVVRLVA